MMKQLTELQIANLKQAGSSFAKATLSEGTDPDQFDGQSEALDIASAYVYGREISKEQRNSAADYIYEGMLNAIKEVQK